MVRQMESMDMPNWLSKDEFSFSINMILENSLYYPSAGFDGEPVKYFMGNVFSFVYVDYGVFRKDFIQEINDPERGFRGYHIIHKQTISQEELIPNGWSVYLDPDENEHNTPNDYQSWIKTPFCEWIIFERDEDRDNSHNPKRFSLLYLCADGAAAYQALYLSNHCKPKIIAIIQCGCGFGGNWTDFRNRHKIFARSVFYDEKLLPDHIIYGGEGDPTHYNEPIWHEYSDPITTIHTRIATFKLWKRSSHIRYHNKKYSEKRLQ